MCVNNSYFLKTINSILFRANIVIIKVLLHSYLTVLLIFYVYCRLICTASCNYVCSRVRIRPLRHLYVISICRLISLLPFFSDCHDVWSALLNHSCCVDIRYSPCKNYHHTQLKYKISHTNTTCIASAQQRVLKCWCRYCMYNKYCVIILCDKYRLPLFDVSFFVLTSVHTQERPYSWRWTGRKWWVMMRDSKPNLYHWNIKM